MVWYTFFYSNYNNNLSSNLSLLKKEYFYENKKFPHQRQQISTPETTNFHTTEEIFPHQFGQFSFMPGRAACLLYVEHLLYRSLLV